MASEERCVCCGEIIAEGSQVCPNCHARIMKELPDRWLMRDIPKRPRVVKMNGIPKYTYYCWQCGHSVRYDENKYCSECGQKVDWQNTWLHEREILHGKQKEE